MLELVVASGKGGTGKTSLTGVWAELSGPGVLVDCDVDAANLHLIVPHVTNETHDFSSSRRATIDTDPCTACGICLDVCRFGAVGVTSDPTLRWGQRFSVDPLGCEGCGLCARLCPVRAIAFEPVVSGQWFVSEWAHRPFLHACLGIAQSNSGKLVSLLRQHARKIAQDCGYDLVIVDGPPGIGCPVIAALTNSSYLVIVTEPSVSAIHDMERLADLANHFQIPTGVVINKSDINRQITAQVERIACDRGLHVHGAVPFDPAFTKAQLQGRSYMHSCSEEARERMRALWDSVRSHAESCTRAASRQAAV